MIQIKRQILEQIIAMSKNVASKEQARYFLTAVCLDSPPESRRLRLRASNGTQLLESVYDLDSLPELLERRECLVYPEAVASLELMLKQNKRQEIFYTAIVSNKLILKWSPNVGDSVTMGELSSGNIYPNTDAIKPNSDNYTLEFALNPELLLKLFKASRNDANSKALKFKIKVNEKLAPVIVTCVGQHDEYGIIMPVRI